MLEVWRKKDISQPLASPVDGATTGEAAELRRRLHDLPRLVSDWVWEVDADLRFTYVSDRVFDVLGYHPRELYGRHLTELAGIPANGGGPLGSKSPFRNVSVEVVSRAGERRLP